jgi:hypothetical protein
MYIILLFVRERRCNKIYKLILTYLNITRYIDVVTIMIRYMVVHNKHEGCYDFQYYEDDNAKIRIMSITINPPKVFLFTTREQAQDFFEEYIADIDDIDPRCKKNDEIEHKKYCTCGTTEFDDDENPVLFYNKKNQIFLLENGPQVFVPPFDIKNDIKNLNLTNRLIRKCKTLGEEQRNRYIELGNYCQECLNDNVSDIDDTPLSKDKMDPSILEKYKNAMMISESPDVVFNKTASAANNANQNNATSANNKGVANEPITMTFTIPNTNTNANATNAINVATESKPENVSTQQETDQKKKRVYKKRTPKSHTTD